jgi:hypothetical protein
MSANPVVLIKSFQKDLEARGLVVYIDPMPVDPKMIGVRLAYSGIGGQGTDRERISLTASLQAHGVDPGRYLSIVIEHSRILSKLLDAGFEYTVSPSQRKAKATISRTAEGRFNRDEATENLDWIFQEDFRVELSYNPAILDDPDLAE